MDNFNYILPADSPLFPSLVHKGVRTSSYLQYKNTQSVHNFILVTVLYYYFTTLYLLTVCILYITGILTYYTILTMYCTIITLFTLYNTLQYTYMCPTITTIGWSKRSWRGNVNQIGRILILQ